MKIKELYQKYKAATAAADQADKMYEAHPESKELEESFDQLYTRQWDLFEQLALEISNLATIDYKLARTIIMKKGPELDNLLSRLEA